VVVHATTTQLQLTRAQRDLYAEACGDDRDALTAHAAALVRRVVILVRHRCVRDRDSRALLARVERLSTGFASNPLDAATRAALWTTVESITRRPWGPGAPAAIDRLVVAGAIADALAGDV
jgi:hypothetical protein